MICSAPASRAQEDSTYIPAPGLLPLESLAALLPGHGRPGLRLSHLIHRPRIHANAENVALVTSSAQRVLRMWADSGSLCTGRMGPSYTLTSVGCAFSSKLRRGCWAQMCLRFLQTTPGTQRGMRPDCQEVLCWCWCCWRKRSLS